MGASLSLLLFVNAPTICLAGHDERGALFAAGRLLRLATMARDKVAIDGETRLATAPRYALRGHQMGYRPKTHSYDAWDLPMWEQYYRDLVVFGTNAVELVPPTTDDAEESPHFPLRKLDMMIGMSRLAADYGLDVWIWFPPLELDTKKPGKKEMDEILKRSRRVFESLPRLDAVFIPAGDPGDVHPKILLAFMEEQKKVLHRFHPKATIWVSPQNYGDNDTWLQPFFEMIRKEPEWLDGLVFGPAMEIDLKTMRRWTPEKYPIRRYPDITHSKDCQYEVPHWDRPFEETLGREPINPRPRGYARIFRDLQQYSFGFISYSEGNNDDVNKIVWSGLGWDPETKVEEILREYARYYVSGRYEAPFAEGLLMLEKNWEGRLKDNESVDRTLEHFQKMERGATPQEKLNWRFQMALWRAYYDAYLRSRVIAEERIAGLLRSATSSGSQASIQALDDAIDEFLIASPASQWRARVYELAEALFQSIRMQLSVPRYAAKSVRRGGNLEAIDKPLRLNIGIPELKRRLIKIRKLGSEKERRDALGRLAD